MMAFSSSDLKKCGKKLLGSSNNEGNSFEGEKTPLESGKLLPLSRKPKYLNDTVSTPPSALREQISILRKEVNEAYEFHDLEIQILKEEQEEGPKSYAQLIEKYSTLFELYTSLKNEYEDYRRNQEKMRDELQSKTVCCFESLCSQIETSDNSLSSTGTSFVSFNTDFKSSTMIGSYTEKEATLLHDITVQTQDPLSDTNVFKTPKLTPFKSAKKYVPQASNQKRGTSGAEFIVQLLEVETALGDKAKEIEKLEQRLFKTEDLSGILQNEFERISSAFLKENETLKKKLLNKSEQLDSLTQKLFTEIISLNPGLTDSLADTPGTKLLPVFIEAIMEKCKNIEGESMTKFSIEKSKWETRVNNLEEENKTLNKQIEAQTSSLRELKESYEKAVFTRDEEIRILRTHETNMRQARDLALEKEFTRPEAQLSLTDDSNNEVEGKCISEKESDSLGRDLEKIKNLCEATENGNNKLKNRLSEITKENRRLQEDCERLKRQLLEKENVISSRDEEILNLKNGEIKQVKADLTQADEIILKLKAELFATESEKLNFEKRCLELENVNDSLQTVVSTKDTILKDLERFKSSYENEWEDMKQQLKEREVIISDLTVELDAVKEKYLMEVEKTKTFNEEINSLTSAFSELEKSYKDLEGKLLNAERKMHVQEEEVRSLQSRDSITKQMQEDLALAKETITELEAKLLSAEKGKKETDDQYQALEEKANSLSLNLEKIKSTCVDIELENENLKSLAHEKSMEFKFDSLFEILKESKKTLTTLLTSHESTDENFAFKLISEKIVNLPNILKIVENIMEYFSIEWEAKQNVLIENFQNEIKMTGENLRQITSESVNLRETCEQLKTQLKETETIISLRDQEILNFKSQAMVLEQAEAELATANENMLKLNNEMLTVDCERLKYEKRCRELENCISALQGLIITKDCLLKDLEVFKSLHEKECENVKRELVEKEEIISDLKAELYTVREHYAEEIKNREIENLLSALQMSYVKLKDVLSSEKYAEMQSDDLSKLMAEVKSSKSETENRLLTAFMSAVFDVRSKLLEEWEVQKNNNSLSVRDLENKLIDAKQREAEFQKRCEELEGVNAKLETTIISKDIILKDLRDIQFFHDKECMEIKQQLEEKEKVLSDLKIQLHAVKENFCEKIKNVEMEKLESGKRCLELEGANSDLRAMITIKDANLKELNNFKLSCESDSKNMKQQIQAGEAIITNLHNELETLKEQFSEAIKNLNCEKINLQERCLELEDANTNLQTALRGKDSLLKDLEYFKTFHQKQSENTKLEVEEKEEIISNLRIELISMKKKGNEEIQKMENEKLEFEKRCQELEDKNRNLLSLILTKDAVLKDLEVFKSLHEKECENVKRQLLEKEEIISNLKAELYTGREHYCEEIKNREIENLLSALQMSCVKLRDVLSSEKYAEMQSDDLSKLMAEVKSSKSETENRILTAFMSAVFDVRSKLLEEWEVRKNKGVRLIREVKNDVLNVEPPEPAFDSLKLVCANVQEKISEEDVSIDELTGFETLEISSARDFSKSMKKVIAYVKKLKSKADDLKEENKKLDEECDSYAKVIKDLKKEAAIEWKKNNEKMLDFESEILRLTKIKNDLEYEKEEQLGKISKLEEECLKLKSNVVPEGGGRNCGCALDIKKINELKRTILFKEQKLLELQELEVQNNSYKAQIEYLKNALDKERKKINEEREKNKKLQNELNEANQTHKTDNKKIEENQILEELRMRGSVSGGVVQEIVDKEKMRKLSKDVGVLKEICRARYAEIKRLEAENAALKNNMRKNSNQTDSPIRSKLNYPRSRGLTVEKWRTGVEDKENQAT